MKRISSYLDNKSTTTELIIYENEEEWKASGLVECTDWTKVERFDYVKSDDGYYLPVLHKQFLPDKHGRYIFYSYYFPLGITFNNLYYVNKEDPSKSKFRKKIFRYTDKFTIPHNDPEYEVKQSKKRKYLNANERLAAEYIAKGIDIYDAFQLAFPSTKKSTYVTDQAVTKALSKEGFVDYILSKVDMDKIKEALNNIEAHKVAAQSIVDLLNAKKDNGQPDAASVKLGLAAYVNIERMDLEPKSDEKNTYSIYDPKAIEAKMDEKFLEN
jgi:hypothetical protein